MDSGKDVGREILQAHWRSWPFLQSTRIDPFHITDFSMDYGDMAVSRATRTGSLKLADETQSSPSVVIKSTTPMRIVSTPESYPSRATIDGAPNSLDTAANGRWVSVTKRREGNFAFDSPSKSCCERNNPLLSSVERPSPSTPSTEDVSNLKRMWVEYLPGLLRGPIPTLPLPSGYRRSWSFARRSWGFLLVSATKAGRVCLSSPTFVKN